jgi:hypothetical protein
MKKLDSYAQKLAIFGCYSVATVYILIGVMALLSYMGHLRGKADEERLVDVILEIPLGEILISIMILGMIGYIIWRVYEAFTDPYEFGNSAKGISQRMGIGLSAVGYVVIVISAIQIVLKGGDSNTEEDQQLLIAQILEWPLGAWLIGLLGTGLLFTGLIQLKYVWGGDYHQRIQYEKMPLWMDRSTHIVAWWGYIARGIILGVLGYFLVKAALNSDADEVGDTDSAFDFIGDSGALGDVLFILIALGTVAYGLFMIINGYFYSFDKEVDRSK